MVFLKPAFFSRECPDGSSLSLFAASFWCRGYQEAFHGVLKNSLFLGSAACSARSVFHGIFESRLIPGFQAPSARPRFNGVLERGISGYPDFRPGAFWAGWCFKVLGKLSTFRPGHHLSRPTALMVFWILGFWLPGRDLQLSYFQNSGKVLTFQNPNFPGEAFSCQKAGC